MSEDVTGLLGLAILAPTTVALWRAWLTRPRRPRLCACTHGSGMHGLDGCRAGCPCTGYDGAGPRAPR